MARDLADRRGFITDDTSTEIFDQCDVTQVFELKDVSQPVVES